MNSFLRTRCSATPFSTLMWNYQSWGETQGIVSKWKHRESCYIHLRISWSPCRPHLCCDFCSGLEKERGYSLGVGGLGLQPWSLHGIDPSWKYLLCHRKKAKNCCLWHERLWSQNQNNYLGETVAMKRKIPDGLKRTNIGSLVRAEVSEFQIPQKLMLLPGKF